MARIRSVHPGLFTDEDYMALSPYAMAAWPGIWVEADDNGVFEWKPLTLKARLLPCAPVEMTEILAEYQARELVLHFEVEGRQYGAIRNFRKFQRPEKPKSWHPLPEHLRAYVFLPTTDQQPITDELPTAPRKAPQMEDGGGRREKKAKPETTETDARSLRSPSAYAFAGKIIRLNQQDFDNWERTFHGYPDLRAELATIDAKLVAEGHAGPWLGKVSGWLRKGHETRLASREARQTPEDTDTVWRGHLRAFVKARDDPTGRWRGLGYWPETKGPPPGRAGCQAPRHLLAEFGLLVEAETADAR